MADGYLLPEGVYLLPGVEDLPIVIFTQPTPRAQRLEWRVLKAEKKIRDSSDRSPASSTFQRTFPRAPADL
jgi:hypothetical protein